MNEYIKLLAEIDYVSLIFAVATIAVVVVGGKELIEKFCNTIGLEFSWIRKQREVDKYREKVREDLDLLQNRQEKFEREHREGLAAKEKFNKEMMDALQALRTEIDDFKKTIEIKDAEKHFKKLRFDLLNFADKIISSQYISDELISQVFSEIDTYHTLAHDYGFENGKVNASIAVIQKKYEELLAAGRVVKGDIMKGSSDDKSDSEKIN